MEKYKLSELIVIKNGRDHKDLPNGDYPVFGSGGIMRYVNSYLYDKPSVLLPRKGSLSNIQWSNQRTMITEYNIVKVVSYVRCNSNIIFCFTIFCDCHHTFAY